MSNKVIFFVMLLSFTTMLFAGSDYETRSNCPEPQKCQIQEENIATSLVSARNCYPNCGFFVDIEFLYWRADQNGFIYAFHNKEPDLTLPLAPLQGDWIRIKYDWDSGFRGSLGWNSNYDDWDLLASWTYYHNRSTDTTIVENNATGLGLATVWISQNQRPIVAIGYAKATWKLDYNMFDFECGRNYFIGKKLSIRPFLSIRGGWLNQDFHIQYEDSLFTLISLITPATYIGKSDYWGVGPRIGANTSWYMTKNFKFFGNVSTALLYGKTKALSRQDVTDVTTSTFYLFELTNDSFKQLVPNFNLLLGASWGTCFCKDKIYLGLDLGWEVNYWWDQFRLNTLSDLFYTNPVTLQGLTVGAKLDF